MVSSSISMAGMGTSLDIHSMAKAMAKAKTGAKANQLHRKETSINKELSGLNTLASSLNSFYNTLNKFSDASVFGATTTKMDEASKKFATVELDDKAVANTYQLAVTQLATHHKVEWASGDTKTARIPAGEHTLSVGNKTMSFTAKDGANSLAAVAKLINNSKDNPGIIASVMKDGSKSHLTLTTEKSGKQNIISIDGMKMVKDTSKTEDASKPDDQQAFPPGSRILTTPQDAKFTVDGVAMSSPENKVSDVIEGVTLNLKDVTTGKDDGPININIEPDTDTIQDSIKAIVDSFNKVIGTIDTLTESSTDADGNVVRTALAGDSMINGIERELRTTLYTTFDDTFGSLASIGIVTDAKGKLEIDNDKLKDALEQDFDAVSDMFVEKDGIIDGFQQIAAKYIGRPEAEKDKDGNELEATKDASDGYIPATGLLDTRIDNVKESLSQVKSDWKAMEARQKSYYQRYLNEYIAMDLAVSKMKDSYGFL